MGNAYEKYKQLPWGGNPEGFMRGVQEADITTKTGSNVGNPDYGFQVEGPNKSFTGFNKPNMMELLNKTKPMWKQEYQFSQSMDDLLKEYERLRGISSGNVSPATELANKNKALSTAMTASALSGIRGNNARARNIAYGGADQIARIQTALPEQIQAQKQEADMSAAARSAEFRNLSNQYLTESQKYQGDVLGDMFNREKNKLQDQMIIAQQYQDYLNVQARLNKIERGEEQADANVKAELQNRLTAAAGNLTQLTLKFASTWGSGDSDIDPGVESQSDAGYQAVKNEIGD